MQTVDGHAISEDHWTVSCPECGREFECYGFFDPEDVYDCRCRNKFRCGRICFEDGSYIKSTTGGAMLCPKCGELGATHSSECPDNPDNIIIALKQRIGELERELAKWKQFESRIAEKGKCPQCGESLVYPRGDTAYCEECGYPDSDFDEEEIPQPEKEGESNA